jgi:hypothetical protein
MMSVETVHMVGVVCAILVGMFVLWNSGVEPDIPVIQWDEVNHLKTWRLFFQDVFDGGKNFEIRKADRFYASGQVWYLREWVSQANPNLPPYYTGSWVKVEITYVVHHRNDGPASGIAHGFCVWGFKVLERYDCKRNLHLRG